MKLLVAMIALCLSAAVEAGAQQKIGHVNAEAIMQKLPDAADAQKQLDALVADWQNELNRMQTEWKKRFDEYDQKKLIMTDARRAEAEKDLRALDQRIAEYRNQKFGQNGELFQKQNELMKPVQDRVFKAIQDVATEEGLDYILDQSGEILMMYANPRLDLTPKVLEKLLAATSLPQQN
ncbi:MAG: OmpH family outer membrane protein [Ignavibacteriales bacterium]|nr:OmpH family outer membrane protein [Ignavibacteriales bacterium]